MKKKPQTTGAEEMKEPCLCGDPECRACFPRYSEEECPEDNPNWHDYREQWIEERECS